MRVLLSTRGSRGDVHPILALAGALAARGHESTVCVPKLFLAEAERRGLRAVSHGEDSRDLMAGFGRDLAAVGNAGRWLLRSIEDQFDYLLAHSGDVDVLVASTTEIAAPSVADYRSIPYLRVALAPWMTSYESNVMLPWQGMPPLLNRAGWGATNALVNLAIRWPIQRQRRTLGLPPIAHAAEYVARRGHTLFAMSQTLAPPCPSWHGRYRFSYCGYFPDPFERRLPDPLRRFIASGPPPIYVGLGSVAVADPSKFTAMVRDAALQAGCRVILGAGWTGLGDGAESSFMYVAPEVDHQALFPLVVAAVHHGGSGTTQTAARAGIAQMALPQLADQHYWGHRIAVLELGPRPILVSKLTTGKLAVALRELVRNQSFALNAARVGRGLRAERGTDAAVEVIEDIAGRACASLVARRRALG